MSPVRELIAASPVAHADETTARAASALTYLHVACTQRLTVLHVGDWTRDTIDAGGIWLAFSGVLVRDGYAGYEHLDQIEHAWCGIHLVRDLRAVPDPDPDPEGQSWAEAMPGKDDIGVLMTIVVGIAGSVVGGIIFGLLTVGLRGFHPAGWIGSIIGAVIVLVLYNSVTGRKRRIRR